MHGKPSNRTDLRTVTPQGVAGRFGRTLERQLEEILSQVAPQRQTDGPPRGVVSILFVTIDDFVALCEDLEPPEIGSVLEVYLETVADSISKFLGTIQSALGDTVMATWNAVYPQADHAILAVNSALDMVERIDDVNGRLRARGLGPISYAVGVTTGDALLRHSGLLRRENEVVGDTVNVAHLLSLLASDCTILIAEGTRVSAGDQILAEEIEITALPGKRRSVRIYRVIGRPEEI